MARERELPACPVATTLVLINSKWKVLILRDLFTGPKRFNELKRSLEGISQKVLTASLKEMVEDELIVRHVFPEVPPHTEYDLTDLGRTMKPILDSLEHWGAHYQTLVSR